MSHTRPIQVSASTGPIPYVEQFNHDLKVLTIDLTRRCPNDPVIYRAKQRVMTAIFIDPLFVINLAGPYLYKYRSQVYALVDQNKSGAAEEFFLENSYDADLKASVDQERADLVACILPKAKDCARGLEANEKRQYINIIVGLLDSYVEYLSAVIGLG